MPKKDLIPPLIPQTEEQLARTAIIFLAAVTTVATLEVIHQWADFIWLLHAAFFPPAP